MVDYDSGSVGDGRQPLSPGKKIAIWLTLASVVVVLFLIGNAKGLFSKKEPPPPPLEMSMAGQKFRPPTEQPNAMPVSLPEPRLPGAIQRAAPKPRDPREEAINSDILAISADAHGSGQNGAATAKGDDEDGDPNSPLAARLKPTRLPGVKATVMKHPELTIEQGRQIPCTQQTAMNSSYPGFVSANIPIDVRGAGGHVTLLDAGSTVFGTMEHGIINGLDRQFVLWNQVTTPNHVRITLDSPAADEVGATGLEGDVDRHIWKKISGVLMMSLIQGSVQAAIGAAQAHGGNQTNFYQFGSGVDSAADIMLRSTIDIPDVLTRPQGGACTIFVARDLDMSNVYRLTMGASR